MIDVPGYALKEEIHRGSTTSVLRGIRLRDLRPVILKIPHSERPDLGVLARIKREFEILKDIGEQGVAKSMGLEHLGRSNALILEDIGGLDLRRCFYEQTINIPTFLDLAMEITAILGRIHQCLIIHKDINPANIIFNRETGRVQIIDFGIASQLSRESQALRHPGALEGTLRYMSPEQTGRMNRSVDYRTDFYSLGMTFYELIAGQPAFTAKDALELVHCHLAKTPKALTELREDTPTNLVKIINKLIAKAPENRYQTIRGIICDLERCRLDQDNPQAVATFKPGAEDRSDQFHIPEKLYGREDERNKLIRAFDKAVEGYAGVFMISGYAGMGKTALVREIIRALVSKRGYYISGKFDQLKRDIPYASLIQAFQDLIHQLLTESKDQLSQWRRRLSANLGSNAKILTDVLPDLELIIGEQPEVSPLPATESQLRFQRMLHQFVNTIATQSHPLVIFLDDLQWADVASLNVIKMLTTDFDSRHLLIVGSYRTNECPPGHPLMLTLEELRLSGANLSRISLKPLELEDISQLLADTLHCSRSHARPLAQVCLNKTSGNPFFLNQFLIGLHEDGLITYDYERNAWCWRLEDIDNLKVTESLIDFMLIKIRRLPEETQRVLQLAACIGNQFDLHSLSLVNGRPPRETAAELWDALEEGHVLPLDENYKFPDNTREAKISYRFLHDRVQQAAYAMLDEEEKRRAHLQIGRLMYGDTDADHLEERAYDIVNQLNLGLALISSPGELINLCQLNLLAGRRAKSASAFESAMRFFEIGIDLLPNNAWRIHHDLSFSLHLERAECQHICGLPQAAEASFDTIFKNIHTRLQKARVYAVKILVETHLNRPTAAIGAALEALALFDIHFPKEPTERRELRERLFAEIQEKLGRRAIETLVDAPPMEKHESLALMLLLMNVTPPTFYTDQELFSLIILQMTLISLKDGNAPYSTFAYVHYGSLLVIFKQDYQTAHRFGRLALDLGERFERTGLTYKVGFVYAAFINHWVQPIKSTYGYLQQAEYYAFEAGDLLFAGYVGHYFLDTKMFRGDAVDDLRQMAERYLAFGNQDNMVDAGYVILDYLQLTKALTGKTLKPTSYDDDHFDENTHVAALKTRHVRYPLLNYYMHKCLLHLLHEDPVSALEMADQAERLIDTIAGVIAYPDHFFYYGLAITANQFHDESRRSRYHKILVRNIDNLRLWAQSSPANYEPRLLLLEAERARIEDRRWDAVEAYEAAINAARVHEFVHIEALCHELAGKFWLSHRKPDFAHTHLAKAHYDYQHWGASVKADLLASRYLQPETKSTAAPRFIEAEPPTPDGRLFAESTHEYLDLNTVIKASQALSSDIVLDELLSRMLRIMLENAGAQQGCLVLSHSQQGDDYRVEVEGQAESGDVKVLPAVPLEDYPNISPSIINYTLRTRDFVVLNDAAQEGLFTADRYIVETRPKSVLCLPILHQSRLYGALYLENNLTTGAFTAERLEVLRILAAQAAISLTKARLYGTLEEYSKNLELKVTERTDELERKNRELGAKHEALMRTQEQLILREKLASLGALTAGIAHEIRNPLNFINNFSRVTTELIRELKQIVAKHQKVFAAADFAEISDLLNDFEQNNGLIERHGERAETIVSGLLQLSKGKSGIRADTDLNNLVQEYVKLAYNGLLVRNGTVEVEIEYHLDDEVGAQHVAHQDLGRAMINLVDNACYAMTEKAKDQHDYHPRLTVSTKARDEAIQIIFHDNGVGVPMEIRDKIFNPFFTTKPANHQHIGLGLFSAIEIIHGHQGQIDLRTEPGLFAEFTITLPRT